MRIEVGRHYVDPAPERRAEERKETTSRKRLGEGDGRDDSVRFSSRARELQETGSEISLSGPRSEDSRLDAIRERLERGYYDTEEAVDALIQELTTIFGL